MSRFLVTGGSRGLGLAICARLLDRGHDVVTCARRETDDVRALAKANQGRLTFHSVDLADGSGVARFAEEARVLDGYTGFVANAALGTEGLLTLMSDRAIRECVEVNLMSVMTLTRQVIKGMLGRNAGSLVFVCSVAARTGLSGLSVYGATKGALSSFSRALAREYGERGIRSNCVVPGFLETEMSSTLSVGQRERLRRRTPAGRLGSVSDVVGAVEYLLTGDSEFVTGSELVIDGGMTA